MKYIICDNCKELIPEVEQSFNVDGKHLCHDCYADLGYWDIHDEV